MHELRNEEEPTLPQLLQHLGPVDLVIVEGFKRESHPKIEVRRAEIGKPLLYPDDPDVLAVASDEPIPGAPIPVLDLNDVQGIASLIEGRACLAATL